MRVQPAPDAPYEEWIEQMESLDRGEGDWRSRNGYARRERACRKLLEQKTPEDWRRDIEKLEDKKVRPRVAAIVWWDYFGSRPASNPWRHLDRYLKVPYVEIDPERIKRGLVAVGYTPYQAHKRCCSSLSHNYRQK